MQKGALGRQLATVGLLGTLCTAGAHARPLSFSESPHRSRPWSVLVLFSEDTLQPATEAMQHGLMDAVSAIADTDAPRLYFEYLDRTRPTDERCPDDVLAETLQDKYGTRAIDVVVPIGQGAIEFVARRHGALWPNVPVLFAATHNMSVDPAAMLPAAAGMVFRFTFAETLEQIRSVIPDLRHVAVIRGASELEQARTSGYGDDTTRAGLDYIDLSSLTFADVLARVAALPPHTALFVSGPLVDVHGRATSAWSVCAAISAASNSPTFTTASSQLLGCGTTGGPMRDFRTMGRRIGERSVAMRTGLPRQVEVIPAAQFTTVTFDGRALQRWHIDARRLPPGSAVAFSPATTWTTYRTPILISTVGLGTQMLLLVGFVALRRRERSAVGGGPSISENHAGVVARELISPLGAIHLNAAAADRLLGSNPVPMDMVREIVRDLRTEEQRARTVLQRHGALAPERTVRGRQVNVASVLRAAIDGVSHERVREYVDLDISKSAGDRIVAADPVLLSQAIANVAAAAVESATTCSASDRRVAVTATPEDEQIVVKVAAAMDGAGSTDDTELFDRFVRKQPFEAAIGLLTARDIIHAHGGTIQADAPWPDRIVFRIAVCTIR
jgi:signal transduction histidine kinase